MPPAPACTVTTGSWDSVVPVHWCRAGAGRLVT